MNDMEQKIRKHTGYTLIETTLVIAVIAVMVLFAINYLQDRQTKKNLDLTAKQIESLLQVAVSYSSRENEWPNDLDDLEPDYIKDMDLCSPWPGRSSNKECTRKEVYKMVSFPSGQTNKTASYFGISVTLPNATLAERMNVLLPNSVRSGNKITTYVLARRDVVTEDISQGWIDSAGIIRDNGRIDMPICDEGYEGHVIFTPQEMTTDSKVVGVININDKNINIKFIAHSIEDKTSDNPYIFARGVFNKQENIWVRKAYFFTFCVPNGKWEASFPGRYGSPPTSNDAQCSDNWRNQYNDGTGVLVCGQRMS